MTDILTALFGNIDSLSILIAFCFPLGMVAVSMLKNLKLPSKLILLNFMMFFTALLLYGFQYNLGINPIFVILVAVTISGLGVTVANLLFLGNYGTENKIFLSYTIFLILTLFFVNQFNQPVITGNILQLPPPILPYVNIDTGNNLVNAIINFFANIPADIINGLNSVYSFFSVFFTLTSTFGILNIVLFLPFFFFISKMLLDYWRGRNG
jgi:hypothetical protein